MPEEALLELTDETELAGDETELPGDGAEGAEGETKGGEAEPVTPVTALFQPDGKLDPQVNKSLLAIKTENPSLGKLLYKAVQQSKALEQDFPGGLTEARELRDKVEEMGGFSGIEAKLESAKDMDAVAKYFMDADPAFVDDLIASSPESFAALAPVVLDKFAEAHPEAYAARIGRIVYSDMMAAEIPLLMARFQDVIGDNPKAIEVFQRLNDYLGGWKGLASKQVPAAKATPAQPKKDDLSAREEALRVKEWKAERDTAQRTIVDGEYTKALAGRKPDTEERAQIRELFQGRAARMADNLFKGWQEKSKGFIQRNDKAGYIRYMQSIYRRVAPEAMASAVNSTLKGKKAAAATVPVKKAPTAQGAPVAGFKPVAKEPNSFQIDYSRTSKAMIEKNQAVLTDGTKVQWK